MKHSIDQTCDPALRSWIRKANDAGCDFPIQNLPYGVFRDRNGEGVCIGVAIGDAVLDVHGIADDGLLAGLPAEIAKACRQETLNQLMSLGPAHAARLRARLSMLLREDADLSIQERIKACIFPQNEVMMLLPAAIGDYTDFYASIDHAARAGRLFRPDRPLLPNYKHIPIGYHGRASSLIVSGADVAWPHGQVLKPGSLEEPEFVATRMLDYEAELGFFVGVGNDLGDPVPIDRAASHLFGACLVNDWSARDIQAWEYQPLGPFLAKSFATGISPWVVTMDALAPFRIHARARGPEDPALLSYLDSEDDRASGALNIQIDVRLKTSAMREAGMDGALLSSSNTRELYWTPGQMLTHHASGGCNLRPGDLFATGTVSGAGDGARGCLLELTERGTHPITLPNGEQRSFLQDGDEVTLSGYCLRDGAVRIGFGECRGTIRAPRSK